MKIVAPGGGGWGNPLEREEARVLADVEEGFVTPEAARRDYGLELTQTEGEWAVSGTPGERSPMKGVWIEREPMYLSFDVYTCEYCGKNCPRFVWIEDIDGEQTPFCTPEVADIYLETRDRHDSNTRRVDSKFGLTEQLRLIKQNCAALEDRQPERRCSASRLTTSSSPTAATINPSAASSLERCSWSKQRTASPGRFAQPAGFTEENLAWVLSNLDGVTGPIYVKGATPEHVVAITLHDVEILTQRQHRLEHLPGGEPPGLVGRVVRLRWPRDQGQSHTSSVTSASPYHL